MNFLSKQTMTNLWSSYHRYTTCFPKLFNQVYLNSDVVVLLKSQTACYGTGLIGLGQQPVIKVSCCSKMKEYSKQNNTINIPSSIHVRFCPHILIVRSGLAAKQIIWKQRNMTFSSRASEISGKWWNIISILHMRKPKHRKINQLKFTLSWGREGQT